MISWNFNMLIRTIVLGLVWIEESQSAPTSKCGVNEEFRQNLTHGVKVRNCQDWCPGHISRCSFVLKFEGCVCKSNFFRDPSRQGTCVAVQQCGRSGPVISAPNLSKKKTPSCPLNEVYSRCADSPPSCQAMCPNLAATYDKDKCTKVCRPGCRCANGYYRNPGQMYRCTSKQVCDNT